MKIKTEYVYPPIPLRQFDWCAYDDDTYDGPGIRKGINTGGSIAATGATREEITDYRRKHDPMWSNSKSEKRKAATAERATIPPELANCVADYAERILPANVPIHLAAKAETRDALEGTK